MYPEGAWRPEHGVQRGSVVDMTVYPGDPLTPGWANECGARQLDRHEDDTLLRIPVMPISYGDALPLLRQLGFAGESEGGIYHSVYDSFAWYTRFGDPTFSDGAMLSRTVVTLLARLAEASVLPFQFVDTARTISMYITEIEQEWKGSVGTPASAPSLDLGPFWAAIGELRRAANDYETAFVSVPTTPDRALRVREADLAAVNDLLLSVERLWADDEGLPGRPWFRHLLYAPGLYTGYAVKTLPGIREAIEQRRWDEAARQLTSATAAMKRVTTRLKETSARLREVTRRDASGTLEPIVRR